MRKVYHGSLYIARKLWLLLAIVLVVAAITVSALRALLPYLDDYKEDIASYIEGEVNVDVEIGALTANWTQHGPRLVIGDLKLVSQDQSGLRFSIRDTYAQLDVWESMLNRQLRFKSFRLDGVTLAVDPERGGGSSEDVDLVGALADVFFVRLHQFEVTNSILLIDSAKHDSQPIYIDRLSWQNREDRHQARGLVYVDKDTDRTAKFTLDLTGGSLDRSQLRGTLFVEAEELQLTPWLNRLAQERYQVHDSILNLQFWVDFHWGGLDGVWLALGQNRMEWERSGQQHQMRLDDARLSLLPTDQGWQLAMESLDLALDQQRWQPEYINLLLREEGLAAQLSDLPVALFTPLATLWPAADDSALNWLQQAQPTGQLHSLEWVTKNDPQAPLGLFNVRGEMKGLSWRQVGQIPGADALSARFDLYADRGELELDNQQVQLSIDQQLLSNPLLKQLSGKIHWQQHQDGWRIVSKDLTIADEILKSRSAFELVLGDTPQLQLYSDLALKDAGRAKDYYPHRAMDADLIDYLSASLLSGHVDNAQLVWHGAFAQFPYASHDGIFQTYVDLRDSTFKFDPEWPALTELALDLWFENDGLWMTSNAGLLHETRIRQLEALIPEFVDQSQLQIQAEVETSGPLLRDVMLASNLADSVGQALTDIDVAGPLSGKFTLDIALYDTEHPVHAEGRAILPGNTINVRAIDTSFTDAQGELTFVNGDIQAKGLNTRYYDLPLTLDLLGQDKEQEYLIDIRTKADWGAADLAKALPPALQPLLQGQLILDGDLQISVTDDVTYTQFNIRSDLAALESDLPAPFAKPALEKWALNLRGSGEDSYFEIFGTLHDRLQIESSLSETEEEVEIDSLRIVVGERDGLDALAPGFEVAVDLAELQVFPWLELAGDLVAVEGPPPGLPGLPGYGKKTLFPPLERINARVDRLLLDQYQLPEVNFTASRQPQAWDISLTSPNASLHTQLADDFRASGIEIAFKHLKLDQVEPEALATDAAEIASLPEPSPPSAANLSPRGETLPESARMANTENSGADMPDLPQLPPLTFRCDRCQIGEYALGEVQLQLTPWPEGKAGMQLEKLRIASGANLIEVDGDWQMLDGRMTTRLNGQLSGKDVGSFGNWWNMKSPLRDSDMRVGFELNWLGEPQQFNFETLDGDINMRFGEGYVTEVDDKGARWLAIFSVESMLRKLRLDFKDVYKEGLHYSRFRGDMSIENGLVTSDNLRLNGPAGNMEAAGQSDLVSQQLDYDVTYYPKLTASLPVLSAFAITPITGVYVLAASMILDPVVEVVYQINFEVTGSIDEPLVREVGRKSTDVELPQPPSTGTTTSDAPADTTESQPAEGEQPASLRSQPASDDPAEMKV